MEGLENSFTLTLSTKMRLTGEVLFIRAFCYFYLVNLFGDVPLATTTDYQKNVTLPRAARMDVYQQIIADLKEAQNLLPETYITTEKIRANKWAAVALLARTYLFAGGWPEAEVQATAVIDEIGLYGLDSLKGVFLKNSREAIWQLKPNAAGINTWDGNNFILTTAPATGERGSSSLSSGLLAAFESGDERRGAWVDSIVIGTDVFYFPFKYQVKTGSELWEYQMVLRLSEQYLIRAEARAHQGNLTGAKADLNMIRHRAGLPDATATNRASILAAIAHERRVELFTEWAHRWLDLKRTGRAGEVLSIPKAPHWKDTDTLYPLPFNELSLNRNLVQNMGY